MTKVPGKTATVTYDIVTDDQELEGVLERILSEVISPLVNESKASLMKKALTTIQATIQAQKPVPAASGATGETTPSPYKRENIEVPFLIPLGGKWAYSVSIVTNQSGRLSVRVSKGTIKGGFYRNKKTDEMVLTPDDPMNPISQVVHINVDRLSDWERLQAPVIQRLRQIEQEVRANSPSA